MKPDILIDGICSSRELGDNGYIRVTLDIFFMVGGSKTKATRIYAADKFQEIGKIKPGQTLTFAEIEKILAMGEEVNE